MYLHLSGILDLEALKNLRRLVIIVPISEKAENWVDILLDIAQVLSTFQTSNNRLETISLDIMAFGDPPWPSTRTQDWAAVVRAAGRLSMGRGLLLKVKMGAYSSGYIELEDARRDLYTYLDNVFQEALVSHTRVEYRSVHLM
jgi:hypothetical protein